MIRCVCNYLRCCQTYWPRQYLLITPIRLSITTIGHWLGLLLFHMKHKTRIIIFCDTWPQFYQTRSAWSMDQGSTKKRSAVHNFVSTVTKFCVMWEGLSLPHDTKFGNCRGAIVDRRVIFIWSLIHGSSWSGLIKVGHGMLNTCGHHIVTDVFYKRWIDLFSRPITRSMVWLELSITWL